MEGQLSMEDDNGSSTSPTRRRVLKASAALSATGIVGSGFVGTAIGGHTPCPRSTQCDAGIDFRSQTVGDSCPYGTACDTVMVRSVNVTCPNGGWIDLHDKARTCGPSGCFKAGYPVGMSTMLQQGTHTDVCINLFYNNRDVGGKKGGESCTLEWSRCEWPSDTTPSDCREMGAMLHLDAPADGSITHYCNHEGPGTKDDHAYLCDIDGDGDLEPINDVAVVCGDGTV